MKDMLAITKALADENRIRAVMMLRHGELCVCQIIEMLGLAPSTVSKHMSILRQADLVDGRKQGRWMYYRLPGRTAAQAVKQAIKLITSNVAHSPQIQKDDDKLKRVLDTDKETLCKKQTAR
jgi:ArsR family transcriptional regulator, arsenate/arsenite/antimonite-responsive transcriptional repressor